MLGVVCCRHEQEKLIQLEPGEFTMLGIAKSQRLVQQPVTFYACLMNSLMNQIAIEMKQT